MPKNAMQDLHVQYCFEEIEERKNSEDSNTH